MNTIFSCVSGKSFRKAIASFAIVAALISSQAASAQSVTVADNITEPVKNTGKFEAFAHPLKNSISMKVHFVNPDKENITIAIYDQSKNVVYRKIVGREAVFHGRFDLASLPDGAYTVTVHGRKDSYSRAISIQTQQERFALAE